MELQSKSDRSLSAVQRFAVVSANSLFKGYNQTAESVFLSAQDSVSYMCLYIHISQTEDVIRACVFVCVCVSVLFHLSLMRICRCSTETGRGVCHKAPSHHSVSEVTGIS